MANNYLQFSFRVECGPEELGAFVQVLTRIDALRNSGGGSFDDGDADNLSEEDQEIVDGLSGVRWKVEEAGVWFYSEEGGAPGAVAELVQACLEQAKSDQYVWFTWAETCSKPRINEFGGGGAVVHREHIEYFSPYQLIHAYLETKGVK